MNIKLNRGIYYILLCTLLITAGCQKEVSTETGTSAGNTPATGSFEAKIDGKLVQFKLLGATLLRSTADNLKRMDMAGVSTDGSKQIIITIGDSPATGNGVAVRDYVIDLFNEDDPDTPEDESLGNDDGFITLSERIGNGWITDVYSQKGLMKVTACDANAKKVSGTFSVTHKAISSNTTIVITEGKFTNISYTVLN